MKVNADNLFIHAVQAVRVIGVKPELVIRYLIDHLMSVLADADAEFNGKLAAVSSTLLANTAEGTAARIANDHPMWTVAYQDACTAVDREIAERHRANAIGDMVDTQAARIKQLEKELSEFKIDWIESEQADAARGHPGDDNGIET